MGRKRNWAAIKEEFRKRRREYLARKHADGQSAAGPAVGVAQPTTASPQVQQLSLDANWLHQVTGIRRRIPRHRQTMMSVRPSGFSVAEVYADGTFVGAYSGGDESCRWFVRVDQPHVGCSCRESNGQFICNHTYCAVTKVIEELGSPTATVDKIRTGAFSRGQFVPELFKYDEVAELLERLGRLQHLSVAEPDVCLPPVTEVQRERVCWHLSLNSPPHLALAKQQPAKRGGWKKGRTATRDEIAPKTERTVADEAVLQLMSGQPYWLAQVEAEAVHALTHLIGQDNVLIDGQSFQVLAGDAALKLAERDGRWSLVGIDLACPAESPLLHFATDGILAIDSLNNRLFVSELPANQVHCMRSLLHLPPISQPHQVSVLLERCQQLQSIANIILPNNYGTIVEEVVTPVVLLRSRAEGFVEFGFRVRDSQGQLHLPARGVLLSTIKTDTGTMQRQRSRVKEHAAICRLQQQLELPSGSIHGKVDFARGLKIVDQLAALGDSVEVLWDEASDVPIRSLGSLTSQNVRVSISKKRDWFQLEGQCELPHGNLEISELVNTFSSDSLTSVGGFVRIGEHGWAQISDELKENLRKLADAVNVERGQLKFDHTAALALRDMQDSIQLNVTEAWNKCQERLAKAEALDPKVPKALKAELRDYQVAGFAWMRRLAEWGVGGVLADDMGLGKTVQTISVLIDRASGGPSLIIAPTSVGFNWMRELERFAPRLIVHSYRETDRNEFFQELGPGHVVVCSYGLALRDVDKLCKTEWHNLVLDEAQAIKNSQSKTSQAIAKIDANWKVALTGTPVENHLGELWSLFRIISPGLFGGWEQFRKRFATPIERDNDQARKLALRDKLRPFILRRTKAEVLRDLPARTEQNLFVELSPKERQLYDKYRLAVVKQASEIAQLTDIKDQRFKLLALLTRLRQIACHARLVEDTWTVRSTKLESMLETLKELRAEGHRALIFSQFVQHLQLIREALDQEAISYQYLDGSTSPAQRQEQVDQFQNGQATAFLISLKAGGTGLNLTGADYVIHMDPWWNPAVEDQATDRAHRIGQTRPVMVYRLIAKNTVEEEILKLHADKRDLVAGILEGTQAASSLSTQELINLLTSQ